MILPFARIAMLTAGFVLPIGFSGCGAPSPTRSLQPATEAPINDVAPTRDFAEAAPQTVASPACYIQADGQWLLVTGQREATCFGRDNCSGGAGRNQPPGTCLKWAEGPEAPALSWSNSLTDPQIAEDIPPPADIYPGDYEMTSDCHEKGCAYGSTRFDMATPLRAEPDARSRVVATIPAGECVDTETDRLMQAPQRGVVLEDAGRFAAGDVIYLTSYEGEGFSTVWRRGEFLHEFQDEAVVRWDDQPEHPLAGYWMQVTRTNGERGWVRDPERSDIGCNPARR